MTDPERLVDAESASLAVTLLRAGRDDAPSERLLGDTLAALGVGAAVVGTGAAASALAASSASTALEAGGTSSLASLAVKWLGIGAVGGALSVGAAVGVEHSLSPTPRPQPVVAARAAEPPPPKADEPRAPVAAVAPPEAPSPPPATPLVSAPASSAKPAAPSIAEETAAIDRARRELARGEPRAALATLDDYDRRPGQHRLQQEALLLRMDALARSGNTEAAKVVAKSLLDQSPNGPHAARARQVLGDASQKK